MTKKEWLTKFQKPMLGKSAIVKMPSGGFRKLKFGEVWVKQPTGGFRKRKGEPILY